MPVTIKSPNADEIFERWKSKNAETVKRNWGKKKVQFSMDQVTAAEYVKEVEKAAVFYFQGRTSIKPAAASKGGKEQVDADRVGKIIFYEFGSATVDKATWKGDEMVPGYSSLAPTSCPKCGGKGYTECGSCKGSSNIVCPKCDGSGKLDCQKCLGKGKYPVDVTVINAKGDKTTKQVSVNCPTCFGRGKVTCYECNGIGKVACRKCKGQGVDPCKNCGGSGMFFTYAMVPVPFKTVSGTDDFIYPSTNVGKLEKELGNEIGAVIEKVDGIRVQNLKELNQNTVEGNLGYFDKGVKKAMNIAGKEFQSLQKGPDTSAVAPIYVFPLLILSCETMKGKRFQIYSVGSDRGFIVHGTL